MGQKLLGGYLPSVLNVDFYWPKNAGRIPTQCFERRLILGQKMLGGYLLSVLNEDFFWLKNDGWIPTQCFKRRLLLAKKCWVDTYPVF